MNKFYDAVIDVLKEDERFFSESGDLLRNAVVEASNKMDAKLIKGLYKNAVTREKFFTDTDGIAVFDKTGFGWVINNREFLPDSYIDDETYGISEEDKAFTKSFYEGV